MTASNGLSVWARTMAAPPKEAPRAPIRSCGNFLRKYFTAADIFSDSREPKVIFFRVFHHVHADQSLEWYSHDLARIWLGSAFQRDCCAWNERVIQRLCQVFHN